MKANKYLPASRQISQHITLVHWIRIRLTNLVVVLAAILLVQNAKAATDTYYWVVPSGSSGNWDVPANWKLNGQTPLNFPGATDVAIFDGASQSGTPANGDCNLNVNVTVGSIEIQSGYSGIISQGSYSLTVGSSSSPGGVTLNAGTTAEFQGSDDFAPIFIYGGLTINGGIFTSTNGILTVRNNFLGTSVTSFIHNDGQVNLRQAYFGNNFILKGFSFNNLDFWGEGSPQYSGYIIDNVNPVTVWGTLSTSGSQKAHFVSGTIHAKGDIVVNNTFDAISGAGNAVSIFWNAKIIINGADPQQIISNTATIGLGYLPNIVVQKPGGNLSMSGNITVRSLTIEQGTVSAPSQSGPDQGLAVYFTLEQKTDGDFQANSGRVHLRQQGWPGYVTNANPINFTFYDLSFLGSGTTNQGYYISGTLEVLHDLTFNGNGNCLMLGGQIHVKENVIAANTDLNSFGIHEQWNSGGSTNIILNGTSSVQEISSVAAGLTLRQGGLPKITVEKPNGIVELKGNLEFTELIVKSDVKCTDQTLVITQNLEKVGGIFYHNNGMINLIAQQFSHTTYIKNSDPLMTDFSLNKLKVVGHNYGKSYYYITGIVKVNDLIVSGGSEYGTQYGDGGYQVSNLLDGEIRVDGDVNIKNTSVGSSGSSITVRLNFTGAGPQEIRPDPGAIMPTFSRIALNKIPDNSGVIKDLTIKSVITVTGNPGLTMNSGKIELVDGDLIMDVTSYTSGGSDNSYVIQTSGNLIRRISTSSSYYPNNFKFPIGDANGYSPLTVTLNNASFPSNPDPKIWVDIYDQIHPELVCNTEYISRYWKLQGEDIPQRTMNVSFTYPQGDFFSVYNNTDNQHRLRALQWVDVIGQLLDVGGTDPNNLNRLVGTNVKWFGEFTADRSALPLTPADFSSVTSSCANNAISFFSTNNGLQHEWDFGDNSVSTLKNPIHIYEDESVETGNYTVTHTLESECGVDIKDADFTINLHHLHNPSATPKTPPGFTILTDYPNVGVCLSAQTYSVTLINISGATATNVSFNPRLPTGMSYAGNPSSNITSVNTDIHNEPLFSLGSLDDDESITFTFDVEACCPIVATPNPVTSGLLEYTLGGTLYYQEQNPNSLNPLIPVLNFAVTPVDPSIPISGSAGENKNRTIKFSNSGFGALSEIILTDEHGPGITITGATVKITGPNVTNYTPQPVTVSTDNNNVTTITIPGTLAPNSVGLFTTGLTFEVTEYITLMSCAASGSVMSTFNLSWGCEGSNCQEYATQLTSTSYTPVTASINVTGGGPQINLSLSPLTDYCYGDGNTEVHELVISNEPDGLTAKELKLTLTENSGSLTDIDVIQSKIEIDFGQGYQELDPVLTGSTTPFTVNIIPELHPGEFFKVKWTTNTSCPGGFESAVTCPDFDADPEELFEKCPDPQTLYSKGGITYKLAYKGTCTNNPYPPIQNTTPLVKAELNQAPFGPTDIIGPWNGEPGETATFGFEYLDATLWEGDATQYLKVVFEYDAGLCYVENSVHLSSLTGVPVSPTVTVESCNSCTNPTGKSGGGRVIATFSPPSGNTDKLFISKLLSGSYAFMIDFEAVCPATATSSIIQKVYYYPSDCGTSADATDDCAIPISCVNKTVNVHCPGCTRVGIHTLGYNVQREEGSRGTIDSDNNGAEDQASTITGAPARLDRATLGDILESELRTTVLINGYEPSPWPLNLDGLQGPDPLVYGYSRLTLTKDGASVNIGEVLKPLGAEVHYTDASNGLTEYIFNIPADKIFESAIKDEIVYDFSIPKLRTEYTPPGTQLPADFTTFDHGDKIIIKGRFQVIKNEPTGTGTSVVPIEYTINTHQYLGARAEPDLESISLIEECLPPLYCGINTMWYCTKWSAAFQLVGVSQTMDWDAYDNSSSACLKELLATYDFIVFRGKNSSRSAFPFEYRNFANLKNFELEIPSDYSFYNQPAVATLSQERQTTPGQTTTEQQSGIPLSTPNPGYSYLFDASGYYGSIIKRGDESIHSEISVLVKGNCTTEETSYDSRLTVDLYDPIEYPALPEPLALASQFTFNDAPISEISRNINIQALTNNITVFENDLCWTVQISGSQTLENVWLYIEEVSGRISIIDDNNENHVTIDGNVYQGGLYQLGTINGTRNITICADAYTCGETTDEDLIIKAGWACPNEETDFENLECGEENSVSEELSYTPLQPDQLFVNSSSPLSIDLCQPWTVSLEMVTAGIAGKLNNVVVKYSLPFPDGVEYVINSGSLEYPLGNVLCTLPPPADLQNGNNEYQWDFSNLLPSAGISVGVPFLVTFKLEAICGFTANQPIRFDVSGTTNCQQILEGDDSEVINPPLNNLDYPSTEISVSADDFDPCEAIQIITVDVSNNDPDFDLDAGDFVKIFLPTGLSFNGLVGNPPFNNATPEFDGNDVEWELNLTSGTIDENENFSFSFEVVRSACGPFYDMTGMIISSGTSYCIESGDDCPVRVISDISDPIDMQVVQLDAGFTAVPDEICLGEQVTFTSDNTETSSIIHSWDFGDQGTSQDEDPVHTFNSASGAVTVEHTITCSTVDCPVAAAEEVFISNVQVSSNVNHVTCNGLSDGMVTLLATGGIPPYTYTISATSNQTGVFTGLSSGSYTATVTDDNNSSCQKIINITINQPDELAVSYTQVDVVCAGAKTGSIDLTVTGGTTPYSYNWSNDLLDEEENPAGLSAGTYAVTITDASGCSVFESITIVEEVVITVSFSTTNVSCKGLNDGAIDLSVSGGIAPYSYDWIGLSDVTQDINGLAAGTYCVVITDNDLPASCAEICITITEPDELTVSITLSSVSCYGGSNGSATATSTGGTNPVGYVWGNNLGTSSFISDLTQGSYSVTVTDAKGCTAATSTSVSQPGLLNATAAVLTPITCQGEYAEVSVSASGGTIPYQDIGTFEVLAGNYSFTVTDFNGCSAVSSVLGVSEPLAIEVSETHQNVTCSGGLDGSIDLTVLGGTPFANPPYVFNWYKDGNWFPQATEDLNDLFAGTYNVIVTDANGCSASAYITITQPAVLSVSTSQTNVSCNGGNNGSINLTVSGGTPAYSFLWSNSATTEDLSALTAGTYTVTVTDANGCTATTQATITQPAVLSASTSQTNVSCNGGSNGTINLTVSGGTPSYSFLWSNSAITEDLNGLAAGTYTVTVTDANGCTATTQATITQQAVLSASTSQTNVSCNGGSSGSINLTVSGGTTAYSFIWSNSAITEDLNGLAAGTYTVTVTDANGCTATTQATITQPAVLSASTSQTNVSCNGGSSGSINLTVSGGTTAYSFVWSNSAITEDLNGLAASTYTVTVTDANGCTATTQATITQPAVLSASTSQTNVSCNGGSSGSINLTVSGGTTTYSFVWSNSAITEDLNGLAAGTYSVTVTDANGCTTTTGATITQPAVLSASTSQTNVSCNGGNNDSINLTVSGGTPSYSFIWSNGAITEDLNGLTAGTYTVTVTDANNCTTTAQATITQPAVLSASTSQTNVSCNGGNNGSINLTVSGGTPSYSFIWSNGAITEDLNGHTAGTYTVTVTDANNCTATAQATITQPAVLSASTSKTDVSCNGGSSGSINLTVSGGTTAYSFVWSNSAITEDLNGLTAGTYTVTVTDANNCTTTAQATITQPAVLSASTSKTDVSCNGGGNGSINLTVSGGTTAYSFIWSNSANTEDLNGFAAGTYTVTVTDANGCTATTQATITQPAVLSASTSKTDVSCNGGSNGSINLTVSGGTTTYSFVWSNSATTEDLSGLAAGTYTVTVTDANGCTTTTSVTTTEPAALNIGSSVSTESCELCDGAIEITINGGVPTYSFAWSNNSSSEDQVALCANNYSVTVTDVNDCSVTDDFVIINDCCPPSLNFCDEVTQSNYNNGNPLEATEIYAASSGCNPPEASISDIGVVLLQGESRVFLQYGFHAFPGGNGLFHAYIAPCSSPASKTENPESLEPEVSYEGKFLVYPNPFTNSTNIEFVLSQSQKISIFITDITGKEVMRLAESELLEKGKYKIEANTGVLSSGLYYCNLIGDNLHETKKLVKISY